MKKVIFCFVFLMLGMISFGSAFQANITVIDDMGSFSGAYLKIKSVESKVFIEDKIYPSKYLLGVGIVKFNLEISLSEIDLNVIMIKDGQISDDFEVGPFSINGSDILIDRREKAEVVEEVVEVVENVSEEVNESLNETDNEIINESLVDIETELSDEDESSGFLSGLVMFDSKNGSFDWRYSVGGGAFLLLLIVFIFIAMAGRRKSKSSIVGEDEKELEYMEKKVKEIEGKIVKIKNTGKVKKKLVDARKKLAEEEAELKELESGGNEKKIEKQEDVVDKAEEKVADQENN